MRPLLRLPDDARWFACARRLLLSHLQEVASLGRPRGKLGHDSGQDGEFIYAYTFTLLYFTLV